jgi:hypothetical protein
VVVAQITELALQFLEQAVLEETGVAVTVVLFLVAYHQQMVQLTQAVVAVVVHV